MKLTIPNQEDITVEQYQLIEKCYIDNGDNDFSDKFLIKTIFGLSFEQIDSVKQSKLNRTNNKPKNGNKRRYKTLYNLHFRRC